LNHHDDSSDSEEYSHSSSDATEANSSGAEHFENYYSSSQEDPLRPIPIEGGSYSSSEAAVAYNSSRTQTFENHEDPLRPIPINMDGVQIVEQVPFNPELLFGDFSSFLRPLTDMQVDPVLSTDLSQVSTDSSPAPEPHSYQSDQWNERYLELVQYKSSFGHCNVPYHWPVNRPLSQWVKRQRHQCKLKKEGKHSNLPDVREQMLNELNFVWDARASNWEERMEELRRFCMEHGHCKVTKTNQKCRPLAVWLKRQRHHCRLYLAGDRTTGMTPERISALVDLGVKLNVPARRI
jgi:hypothetical protein